MSRRNSLAEKHTCSFSAKITRGRESKVAAEFRSVKEYASTTNSLDAIFGAPRLNFDQRLSLAPARRLAGSVTALSSRKRLRARSLP